MEPDTLTAPVAEGSPVEPGPQETPPEVQATAEPQPVAPAQVENGVNNAIQPQANGAQRAKVSDYYREREKYRRLEESHKDTLRKLEELASKYESLANPKQPDAPADARFDPNVFWTDPEKILTAREQKLLAEINTLKQEFTGLKNEKVNQEKLQGQREAMEMLFPKSSPDADEPLEERVENLERKDLLEKLLKANPAIDRLMRIDPKAGAELLLLKLSQAKPAASPNAIPKSLMGSTARGNPSGGAKQKTSADDLMSELKKLNEEARNSPNLWHEPKHKARREQLTRDIERLMQEKGK